MINTKLELTRRSMIAGALSAGGLAGCSAGQGDAKRPPNIVWILSDDQAWHDFGFMGSRIVQTPVLDSLADRSALFPNGYNPTSLCRSSLATMITGKYAFEHGICFNDPEPNVRRGLANELLLNQEPAPALLARAGYKSLQTGKFWEGSFRNGGFTEGMTVGERHGDRGLVIGRSTMEPITQFMDKYPGDPKFIWYAPYLPHTPHNAATRYRAPFQGKGLDRREIAYYANILWFDETVGELIDIFKQRGEYDNTVFMFAVDNGWAPALTEAERMIDPSDGRSLPSTRRSKQSQYDQGVRTPIFIHWAGRIKGARYDDLISTVDMLPTTLSAAGLPPRGDLHGLDLMDRSTGGAALRRNEVYGEIYTHTARDWRDPATNVLFRWIREGDYKLIVPETETYGSLELFNIAEDPFERNDLSGLAEQAETIARLQRKLDEWWSPPV